MCKKLSAILILILSLLLSACSGKKVSMQKTGYYFDTVISFCFYGPSAETAINACMEASARYDAMFNKNNSSSDIYAINHSNGNPVEVSPETIELINLALVFYEKTEGLVTPAIGSVSSLWDFKSATPSLPNDNALSEALKHTDASNIIIEENTVTLTDSELQIDVGFIAKGYVADKLKTIATDNNITSGWINLGGNVLAIGNKPDNSAFNIGIKDPSENSNGSITSIEISDKSVVTSGVYERCFKIDNTLYYHILDTKTGYPVRNNLLSVSVIGPSSAICDGLSTTLFVLGLDEGLDLINSYSGYEAIFITDDLSIITSY